MFVCKGRECQNEPIENNSIECYLTLIIIYNPKRDAENDLILRSKNKHLTSIGAVDPL